VLKEEYAGLLRLEQEVKAHQGALLDVAQEYQPPTQANNPTDIDKKLAKKAKRHLARDGWVPVSGRHVLGVHHLPSPEYGRVHALPLQSGGSHSN
jgi:hypothetical protein